MGTSRAGIMQGDFMASCRTTVHTFCKAKRGEVGTFGFPAQLCNPPIQTGRQRPPESFGLLGARLGRNHPVGIFPAAFLFGILYQGGSEVTFDMPNITRYMFVAVQGVIILFSGALENLFRPQIESFFVNRINKEEMV